MVTTHIRLYRDEDFSQVVDIAVVLVHNTDRPLKQVRSEAEGVIRWASKDESAQIFVAGVDGKIVGFLMLQWPGTGWNRIAEIGWIAVLPDYQKKGIGSSLIQKMEQYAKEKGMRKVYVEPSSENKIAVHFYIENGYKPEGMRKDWYRDGEDSVMLGKHLLDAR